MLRDDLSGKKLDALQARIAAAAAGKEIGGGDAASERVALAWRAALTAPGTAAAATAAATAAESGSGPRSKGSSAAKSTKSAPSVFAELDDIVADRTEGIGRATAAAAALVEVRKADAAATGEVAPAGRGGGAAEVDASSAERAAAQAEREVWAACIAAAEGSGAEHANFSDIRTLVRQACQVCFL